MNKINYDKNFLKKAEELKGKKLLLHSCCAPCSTVAIERCKDFFDLTVYYYNPNIDTDSEYDKRKEEEIKLCKRLGIKVIAKDHLKEDFYSKIKGLEDCPERGERCKVCYALRLTKTAKTAKELSFDLFATTLTLSPLKDSCVINGIGEKIGESLDIEYLETDFKKRDGFLRSVKLSNEFGLYRQNYCGCEFSKNKKL